MKIFQRFNIKGLIRFVSDKKNRRFSVVIVFCLLMIPLLFLYRFRASGSGQEVVAQVDGYVITVEDIAQEILASPAFYRSSFFADPMPALNDYINQIILFREAKKYEHLYKDEVDAKVKNYYIKTLTGKYVNDKVAKMADISEDAIIDYYNRHIDDFIIPERVRIFEIVAPSRQGAEDIHRRLVLGESFSEIAMRDSISRSASRGGDLGWLDVKKLEPEIANLITRIDSGEILADVVRTEIGYHILKSGGTARQRILSVNEASPSIKEILTEQSKKQNIEMIIERLRKGSRININMDKVDLITERVK